LLTPGDALWFGFDRLPSNRTHLNRLFCNMHLSVYKILQGALSVQFLWRIFLLASMHKQITDKGRARYRAQIRVKEYSAQSATFLKKSEAALWTQ